MERVKCNRLIYLLTLHYGLNKHEKKELHNLAKAIEQRPGDFENEVVRMIENQYDELSRYEFLFALLQTKTEEQRKKEKRKF